MKIIDLGYILEAYINNIKVLLGLANKEVEKLYQTRIKICLNCKIISEDKKKCSKEKGGCGCPLKIRLRSKKSCPINKW